MDERVIGDVRQELRVLESELAKERGRLAGLKMMEKDRKRSLRFRIIMTSVSLFLWACIYITQITIAKAVMKQGALDDTLWRLASAGLNVSQLFFSVLFCFWFVFLLFKIWDIWKNSDFAAAQKYCAKRGKKNNSQEQFLCSMRIAGFEGQKKKTTDRLNTLLTEAGLREKELDEEE